MTQTEPGGRLMVRRAPATASRGRGRARSVAIGHRPSAAEIAAAQLLLEPWHLLTSPRFFGLAHVPTDRPFLLVGNHTIMGVLDAPLLVLGLYEQTGVFVRSLGDHLHFRVPGWRDMLVRFGTVDGTRENCRALMRAGEPILVFPGGAREVFKHKGEKYRLIWKNRTGFARMAIEHGCPIVPFAAVGAEECYDILVDSDDIRRSPVGRLVESIAPRIEEIPPLVRGLGPLPRPERFYFQFGTPVETAPLVGREDDEAACRALRARVAYSIEHGIRTLLEERARDPYRHVPARALHRLRRIGGLLAAAAGRPPAVSR